MASQEAQSFKINIEVPKFNETTAAEEVDVFKVNIEAPTANEIRAAAVYTKMNRTYNWLMIMTVVSNALIKLLTYLENRNTTKHSFIQVVLTLAPDWLILFVLIGVLFVRSIWCGDDGNLARNRRALELKNFFYANMCSAVFLRFVGYGLYYFGAYKI